MSGHSYGDRVQAKLVLSILPRKCSISNTNLCLKKAYRKRTIYGSYAGDFTEDTWYSKEEYIKVMLMS